MKKRNNTPKKKQRLTGRLALKITFYILLLLTMVITLWRIVKSRSSKQPAVTSGREDKQTFVGKGNSALEKKNQENKDDKITVKQNKNTEAMKAEIISRLLPIAAVLSSIVALILIWKIADYLIDEHRSIDFWDGLQDTAVMDEEGQDGNTEDEEAEAGEIEIPELIDFNRLHGISKDAVAWLFSPGTKLNYVIAQAEDNDYYLHRLLDGTTASGGTLFEDCYNSADFTDWNTLVYGHNMKNGTMFAELMHYRDPAYYEEHPVMYLYVPGKRYKLELIAGYTTTVDDLIFTVPATKKERDEILYHASRVSSFTSGITAGEKDKLVTLSTCSYAYDDARYVVIGRIVEEMEGFSLSDTY